MKSFTHITEIAAYLGKKKEERLSIGFVPTMGALHAGHIHLVKQSLQENNLTVCSIFVNPIQFNNKSDLEKYPRTPGQDFNMLKECGCDVLFIPDAAEMFPDGENYILDIEFGGLDKVMEGKFRPGHFKGVAVIVKKLLDIIQPSRAYFGKKDFQQLAIIKHMVRTLVLPVQIIPCEIIREPDGLAMSSRNVRLAPAERDLAPGIYRVLLQVKEKARVMPIPGLKAWAIKKIEENQGFRVEYFEIGYNETLLPVDQWNGKDKAIAFTAVFVGDVRLIDNIELFS